jgi:hypothetical protein
VIGKHFLLTVIAQIDMASKERRAAGGDIPQGPFLNGAQRFTNLVTIRRAVEADDLGHLQHEDLRFRGPSSVH